MAGGNQSSAAGQWQPCRARDRGATAVPFFVVEKGVPIRLLFVLSRRPDGICDREGLIRGIYGVWISLDDGSRQRRSR